MTKLCRECKFVIMQPGFWDHLCNRTNKITSCEMERETDNDTFCGHEGKFWKGESANDQA